MSTESGSGRPTRAATAGVAWAVAIPSVLGVLGLGIWFFGGVVAPGYATSILLTFGWFVVAGALVMWAAGRRPELKMPLRVTFLAAAAISAAGFYWTSIRDDTVNEAIVRGVAASQAATRSTATGTPAAPAAVNVEVARGSFVPKAHSGRGSAAVVTLASGGQRLTLTDFETDNGPDLRVYLVKGPVRSDGDVSDPVDLGRLKGNIGNQQYAIPDGTDVAAYSTVVIWCRAFSVSFAQADLAAS
jgi:Electron transfer DM13